jgi:Flp pilus assembly protein TadB
VGRHSAAKRAAPRRPRGTAADLRLLRGSSGLRVQAAAAVIVPFVLYVVVIAVLGRTDRLLVFLGAPVILAGLLFGAVLDRAHRRAARSQPTTNPSRSAP